MITLKIKKNFPHYFIFFFTWITCLSLPTDFSQYTCTWEIPISSPPRGNKSSRAKILFSLSNLLLHEESPFSPLPSFQLPSFPPLSLSLSVSLFLPFKFVTMFVKVGQWRIRLPCTAADMDNLMAACRTKYLILLGCPDSATHPTWLPFRMIHVHSLGLIFEPFRMENAKCDVLDVFLILLRRRRRREYLFVLRHRRESYIERWIVVIANFYSFSWVGKTLWNWSREERHFDEGTNIEYINIHNE